MQKRCWSVQNCDLQRRARNSIKIKNNPSWPSHFTPLPGRPCGWGTDFYHFWLVAPQNRGVFHWLWMSLLQQCYALACYTALPRSLWYIALPNSTIVDPWGTPSPNGGSQKLYSKVLKNLSISKGFVYSIPVHVGTDATKAHPFRGTTSLKFCQKSTTVSKHVCHGVVSYLVLVLYLIWFRQQTTAV